MSNEWGKIKAGSKRKSSRRFNVQVQLVGQHHTKRVKKINGLTDEEMMNEIVMEICFNITSIPSLYVCLSPLYRQGLVLKHGLLLQT